MNNSIEQAFCPDAETSHSSVLSEMGVENDTSQDQSVECLDCSRTGLPQEEDNAFAEPAEAKDVDENANTEIKADENGSDFAGSQCNIFCCGPFCIYSPENAPQRN